uniref:Uncharacterized protein n=1 Tax=Anguilla anguilla TaxID=7936 RepID=A0A0E9Q3T0_ANGAN
MLTHRSISQSIIGCSVF